LDIISTAFTRSALKQAERWFHGFIERQPVATQELQDVPRQEQYYAFVQGFIGGLRDGIPAEKARVARLTGKESADAQRRLEGLQDWFREMSAVTFALPNVTFDRSLILECGDVVIQVRHMGRGHTAGDSVVLVPGDRVVFTGDLAHGIDPLLFEAFPDEWPATLDRLAELEFEVLVPGHGPVQQGKTTLRLFRDYLSELNHLVRQGVSAGKNLHDLRSELVPERFRSLQSHGYGKAMQDNRKTLLGLPPDQPLGPVVSSSVEQVFRFYTEKRTLP
jgi:glyoxylase-like metal-dependent hydrolase (beta-lactamase superfamily II)